jgi:hypothetical protein
MNGIEVQRIPDEATEGALEWGHEALLAWAPWVPHIDTGLFEVFFAKQYIGYEVFDANGEIVDRKEGDESGAQECIERIIPDGPGEAMILQYDRPRPCAAIIKLAAIRHSWKDLFGIDDLVIIPIAPRVAEWIACYFHHGYLELGQLKDDWPHPISLKR